MPRLCQYPLLIVTERRLAVSLNKRPSIPVSNKLARGANFHDHTFPSLVSSLTEAGLIIPKAGSPRPCWRVESSLAADHWFKRSAAKDTIFGGIRMVNEES